MKRFIAIILTLLMCLPLAACSPDTTPTGVARWGSKAEEKLTYTVALFESAADAKEVYNPAENEYDEVLPASATGSYVTTLTHDESAGQSTYVTQLNVTYVYDKSTFAESALNDMVERGIAVLEEEKSAVTVTNNVTTTCVFVTTSLLPVSSTTSVKGAYVGKLAQCANDYTITLNYGISGKKYTCKGNLTDAVDQTRNREYEYESKTSAVYDNASLFLLMRYYDVTKFTSAISLSIIDPLTNPEKSITLSLMGAKDKTPYLANGFTGTFGQYTATIGKYTMVMFVDTTAQIPHVSYIASRNVPVKIQQGYLVLTLSQADMTALGYTLPAVE